MSDWIQYYPDPERKQKMPTSGFVEFTDTFFGDSRKYQMDMSVESIERNIQWNRAAPSCVEKYRFITEEEYLQNKIKHFVAVIEKLDSEKAGSLEEIKKIQARLLELYELNS